MRKGEGKTRQVVDVAELLMWWDRCEKYAKDFWIAVQYARNQMLRRLSTYDRARVYDLIDLLEVVQKPLRLPILGRVRLHPNDPIEQLFNYQKHCIQLGIWTVAELVVYDGDEDALKNFAKKALGSGSYWTYEIRGQRIRVEKLPVLERALVENHLRGWKDWRNATNPQSWVADVARKIAEYQAEKEAGRCPNPVPLDEILETPAESSEHGVTVEPLYSFDAFKDEARRRGDLEVLAYIEGLEARTHLGFKAAHREIRKQMGWDKFEASKIRGRFLRLRDAAADFVTRSPISDGSRNAFFETFYDGERGRPHGEWKHK